MRIDGKVILASDTIATDTELKANDSDFWIRSDRPQLFLRSLNNNLDVSLEFTFNYDEIVDLYLWAHKHHDIIHRAAHGLPYEKPKTKDVEGIRYNIQSTYQTGTYPILEAETLTLSLDGVLAGSLLFQHGQIKVKHLFSFMEIMRLMEFAAAHEQLMQDTFITNSTLI